MVARVWFKPSVLHQVRCIITIDTGEITRTLIRTYVQEE